jgi:protein-disulfide isomerase
MLKQMLLAATITAFIVPAVHAEDAVKATPTGEFSAAQKTEIGKLVREYILANPDVLNEAGRLMQKRAESEKDARSAQFIATRAREITDSAFQTVYGNKDGKRTVVEFFDYNCGYCKRSLADIQKLVEKDPDLRVVLKDMPVLGQPSAESAMVASAFRSQFPDKAWEYHRRLMLTTGKIGKAEAVALAKEMGADMAKLDADTEGDAVKAGITQNMELARGLGIDGTPAFVVGPVVVSGAVGADGIRAVVESVAKCGRRSC